MGELGGGISRDGPCPATECADDENIALQDHVLDERVWQPAAHLGPLRAGDRRPTLLRQAGLQRVDRAIDAVGAADQKHGRIRICLQDRKRERSRVIEALRNRGPTSTRIGCAPDAFTVGDEHFPIVIRMNYDIPDERGPWNCALNKTVTGRFPVIDGLISSRRINNVGIADPIQKSTIG